MVSKRHIGLIIFTPAIAAVLLSSSLLLFYSAEEGTLSSQYFIAISSVSLVGIALLVLLMIFNVLQLIQRMREGHPGTRLSMRIFVSVFLLAILPLGTVSYIATKTISDSIDDWYHARIKVALDNAERLGEISLDAIKGDMIARIDEYRIDLTASETLPEITNILEEIRGAQDYSEISLFDYNGDFVAASVDEIDLASLAPTSPDPAELNMLRSGLVDDSENVSVQFEPSATGLSIRLLQLIDWNTPSGPARFLQISFPLPNRYQQLSQSVQEATNQFNNMLYLRESLKFSFTFALSLIGASATLIALWLALFTAQRLVTPLNDLVIGTQNVIAGRYDLRLEEKHEDDFGVLVESFNKMIGQIQLAQNQASRSRMVAINQNNYLETVLAHLSAGVITLDSIGNLRTFNLPVRKILSLTEAQLNGLNIIELGDKDARLRPLADLVTTWLKVNRVDAEQQLTLASEEGQQILNISLSNLPTTDDDSAVINASVVVVIDDVTDLTRAQRDAAWGEVARRLAHEIKNPLTPIRLSAERMREKLTPLLDSDNRMALIRSMDTIISQVDAMQLMVDDFANYAMPIQIRKTASHINALISSVVDLFRSKHYKIVLTLRPDLPIIEFDQDKMRQVMINLINNAIESSGNKQPRVISIQTKAVAEDSKFGVIVMVSDNGAGMPEDVKEDVFEPYVSTKKRGTGLGLAIVRRIVDQHGGRISIRNIPNSGCRVMLLLPRHTDRIV